MIKSTLTLENTTNKMHANYVLKYLSHFSSNERQRWHILLYHRSSYTRLHSNPSIRSGSVERRWHQQFELVFFPFNRRLTPIRRHTDGRSTRHKVCGVQRRGELKCDGRPRSVDLKERYGARWSATTRSLVQTGTIYRGVRAAAACHQPRHN